ncbi:MULTISPECIES: WbqC family protein [Streptomyces]|uniref:WbqC family protein n=1 Tax=Streptomyces TaxID=1883 RepID=UPI00163B90D3|nr:MULTISPECIES: WbqC family protein [Streptomyces]MBC2879322.1 WbqC family protein [Streptomyces sp. TYQ1024]UBI41317.1 WbqC family protein [Streptomyces mobaraensis]UKW33817.1 WbqC family protein [Streptomyces sp. TYQ1024]
MDAPAVLVAHQPAYLPWPGYFSRLLDVDELVLLDHVQFSERGWQHRNQVRAPGRAGQVWLTVPVQRRSRQPINEVRLADSSWTCRHWRTLSHAYARAPYWPTYREQLASFYEASWERLLPLDAALTGFLLDVLGLRVRLVYSSNLRLTGTRTAMLMNLCERTGRQILRVGSGALAYLDLELLRANGVGLEVATYTHPPHGAARGTAPGLSVLDLVFHEGPAALDVLRAGARTERKVVVP